MVKNTRVILIIETIESLACCKEKANTVKLVKTKNVFYR